MGERGPREQYPGTIDRRTSDDGGDEGSDEATRRPHMEGRALAVVIGIKGSPFEELDGLCYGLSTCNRQQMSMTEGSRREGGGRGVVLRGPNSNICHFIWPTST